MHKRFDFTQLGGFPVNQQRLQLMQEAYSDIATALVALIGNNAIVSGVVVSGAVPNQVVSDGWIVVNGELLPFVGGAYVGTFYVVETATALRFFDSFDKDAQFVRYATPGVGAIQYDFTALNRLNEYNTISAQFNNISFQYHDRVNVSGYNGYNIQARKCLDNFIRIEGVFYPYKEDLAALTGYFLTIDNLSAIFSSNTVYATAYYKKAGVTEAYVCLVTSAEQEESTILNFRVLNPPSGAEMYDSCFVIISNDFIIQ